MSPLPPTHTLPSLPAPSLTPVLDLLFEPSPPLHTLALPLLQTTPFPNYPALIAAIHARLTALVASPAQEDVALLDSILGAHPRLGAKKVESAQSRAEQAQLQAGAAEEAEMLAKLNAEYEEVFPGLRYVVFVNGRGRPVIMADMRRRIERGDRTAERGEAIQAMCDIAVDRAAKLQSAPNL